ncbi:MAG: strawberry notch family protein, partial [Litorimonas sp.]
FLAARALAAPAEDRILEPSAGHGMLALFAARSGARLILNEFDPDRAHVLETLFHKPFRLDAAQIDDRLPVAVRPTAVLMNPPFGSSHKGADPMEAARHVRSAWHRLQDGGRLVAILPERFTSDSASAAPTLATLEGSGRIRLSAGLPCGLFGRKGTGVATRLLVVDRTTQGRSFDPETLDGLEGLMDRIEALPARATASAPGPTLIPPVRRRRQKAVARPLVSAFSPRHEVVAYAEREAVETESDPDAIYTPYRLSRIKIPKASDHVTTLTESAALASVRAPMPDYVPDLPVGTVERAVLSAPQLEFVIYAGQAHSRRLDGRYTIDREAWKLKPASRSDQGFQLRRGVFLGDGTGCGKGRQIAAVMMDNWLKGRRKAVWVSKNDDLLEDAIRDWTALGGRADQVVRHSAVEYGAPIYVSEGILFTTYALIRAEARDERLSRLDQLVDCLGPDFDGVIAFDEAHAMANAWTGGTGDGGKGASLQGLAGLALQNRCPDARIVYASATSATEIEKLGYADRLGLWRGEDAPFASRAGFYAEMQKGGVAAMEMVARDLKALGLYFSRNISFEGVEYDVLQVDLTEEQVAHYDQYAAVFQVLHQNLEAVLESINITQDGTSLNGRAAGAARSVFESTKQRFFGYLLMSIMAPKLIEAARTAIERGDCVVVQIISTGEAVMDRRIAAIDPEDIRNGNFDLSPRDTIIDYLESAFPIHLFETYRDEDGRLRSRPAVSEDGDPVVSQQALRRRHELIARTCRLKTLPSALDQIVWAFGSDAVAEITGRSRRLNRTLENGLPSYVLERRTPAMRMAETDDFMADRRSVLIFSEAGGTGRSYHASRHAPNQRRRHHFLLEAGWRADTAIQGLGRTHRTEQAVEPLFIPCTTDVKGQKRFTSTIARRLDTLGAITKGERETGGQGLFRASDNLEGELATDALRIFFKRLTVAPQDGIGLSDFSRMTGLRLTDETGRLLDDMPTIQRFLNRLLALPIAAQNTLFGVFERILSDRTEAALQAGTLDVGAEVLTGDRIAEVSDELLWADPVSGAETRIVELERDQATAPVPYGAAQNGTSLGSRFMRRRDDGRIRLLQPIAPHYSDDGLPLERWSVSGPEERAWIYDRTVAKSYADCGEAEAEQGWAAECDGIPAVRTDRLILLTGLLLPLWKDLPSDRQTVYRVRTDAGRLLLGRALPVALKETLCAVYGQGGGTSTEAVLSALRAGERYPITPDCWLQRRRVMDAKRYEIVDPDPAMFDLVHHGAFSEVVDYRTRLFLPDDERLAPLVDRLMLRFKTVH